MKYEFLDVSSFTDNEYYADTLNLLELKYNKDNINFIITVDDEAFEFVRANLFNKNCFMYKHKIFFIGVNKRLNLNSDEKDYISGLKDNQSAYKSINLITEALPNTSDIYIALDENTYSKAIVNSIEYNKKLINKQQVNLNYIKSNYLSDIIENIKYIDSTTSAILCCGSFYTEDSKVINSTILINKIKEKTNSPIFTTLYNYLENGAVGGYINSGPNIGYKAAQYSYDIINGNDNSMVIYDYNGLSDKCIMDFKFAERMSRLKPSGIRKVNEKALEMERKGEKVIHFEIGRPDFDTPEYIKRACIESLQQGEVFYTSNFGDIKLREE
ncbi:MAG: ABC transporter substrate binding protein, partial [Clostridium sp.]